MSSPMPRCERQAKSYYCKVHKGGKLKPHAYLCEKGSAEYKTWLVVDLAERKQQRRAEVLEATIPSHRPEMSKQMGKIDRQSAEELIRELYGAKKVSI